MPLLLFVLASLAGPPGSGAVHVVGPDYGVEVAIDRRPVGHLPLDPVALPAGLHLVELLRAGRPIWSRVVYVAPDQTLRLDVALAPTATPSPTLGDLRRGEAPARAPPTRYRLTGRLATETALAGDAWDLDLVQRWRLEADPEGFLSAAVEVRAIGDLAGDGPELWRVVHRADDDPLLVEALWVRAEAEAVAGRAGRLPQVGSMGRAFLLDGARLDGAAGPLAWHARGGRRHTLLGDPPESPWLGGAGVSLGGSTPDGRWSVTADGLYHDGWHCEARGHLRHGPLRVAAGGGLLDADPLYADGRATLDLSEATGGWLTRIRLGGRWRGARRSPFDLPAALTHVLALDTPAGLTLEGGLTAGPGPVEIDLGVGGFDGRGAPGVERPDRQWITLDADLPWQTWGLLGRLSALRSDPGPAPREVALTERLYGGVGASLRWRRLRAQVEVGVERLVLAGPPGERTRTLPSGAGRLAVALSDAFSLVASLDIAGAHPSIDPTGGPWIGSRLGIELR